MTTTHLKLFILIALLAGTGIAQSRADDLKAFPPLEAGMQRIVIRVPAAPNADERKVEVMIGKTVEVDCNRQMFSTNVTRKVAQGWGFPYYVVGELKGPASTLMACPAGAAKHQEFVRAHADELAWLSYNSKLPIVIYVPAGTEVRYRIWSAGSDIENGKAE